MPALEDAESLLILRKLRYCRWRTRRLAKDIHTRS